jgi:hypothetical protein
MNPSHRSIPGSPAGAFTIINRFFMDTKFKTGEVVVERIRPTVKLVVIRYDNGLYYCKEQAFRNRKNIAYMERDLRTC